jgi:hexosaminidase
MVKKYLILSILLLVASSTSSGQIIPNPQSIEEGEGYFVWNSPARVINNLKDKRFDSVIEYVHLLPDSLVTFSKRHNCPIIKLVQGKPNDFVNGEAYELYIKPDAVEIKAGSQAGLFYGIQTLL